MDSQPTKTSKFSSQKKNIQILSPEKKSNHFFSLTSGCDMPMAWKYGIQCSKTSYGQIFFSYHRIGSDMDDGRMTELIHEKRSTSVDLIDVLGQQRTTRGLNLT
jgi:hypothetical protein